MIETPDDASALGQLAMDFCTGARQLMGDLLELRPTEIHCCLKVLVDKDDVEVVQTWARSEPLDKRPDDAESTVHPVQENSVWSALLGRSDTETNWRPAACFHCSDLERPGDRFKCTRSGWQGFYQSTLVFPIRYLHDPVGNSFATIGFLAFDSPHRAAFGSLPCIFDYSNDLRSYHTRLARTTPFHLGALIADTFGMAVRPFYDRLIEAIDNADNVP